MSSYSALQRYQGQIGPMSSLGARRYGLCSGFTTDSNGELAPTGEPTDDPSYQRVALPSDPSSWTISRDLSTGDLLATLVSQPALPVPSQDWGTMSYYIIAFSDGTIEDIKPLRTPQSFVAGQPGHIGLLVMRLVATPA